MTWDLGDIAKFLLLTVSPISELRGGIPLGIALGLDPLFTFLIAIVANALIFFPVFFALRLFYDRFLFRIPLFGRYLASLRKRGKPRVDMVSGDCFCSWLCPCLSLGPIPALFWRGFLIRIGGKRFPRLG